MTTVKTFEHPERNYDLVIDSYSVYEECFTPLLEDAVQNHLMSFSDFENMWWDINIEKHLVYADDQLAGMSVVTNKLSQWPLISPEYFAKHYPDPYNTGRIWYVGFVCVAPEFQKTGAFQELLGTMTAGRKFDLFFMDFCKTNIDRKIVLLCTRALSQQDASVTMDREDVQEFWKVQWNAK